MSAGHATMVDWDKPPIALVDPESGNKVRLRLRHMSFARELQSLPSDLLKVHELLIEHRASRNGSIYTMVAAWNKLRVYEKYWVSFKFSGEDEYLAYYGLPDGSTLAGWTVMVNLFDKMTFVLLGDEVLSFLMRSVGQYQSDIDERKKDYQAIFDRYCDMRETFDKVAFYTTVRGYVKERYETKLAHQEGVTVDQWQKNKSHRLAGTSKRRTVVRAPEGQTHSPGVSHDFEWKSEECSLCRAWGRYAASLEKVIRERLGEKSLPHRPTNLK